MLRRMQPWVAVAAVFFMLLTSQSCKLSRPSHQIPHPQHAWKTFTSHKPYVHLSARQHCHLSSQAGQAHTPE
jgi:hypothetical protein